MIVVNPTLGTNPISFLPRYYEDSTTNIEVFITNEDTRRDLVHNLTDIIKNDGFIFFTTDATFINNSTYRLKVVDNTQELVIFRAKVFATNQIKQNYSING